MPAHRKYETDEARRAARRAASARYRETHREKVRQAADRYREENRETLRAKAREYVAINAETVQARTAAWRLANPDRARRYAAQWAKKNPDLVIAKAHRRRARVAGSDPDLTDEQWQDILYEFGHACAYCQSRGPLEVEHMTPISRGGRHTKANIVPACRSCNARKGTRTLLEFAAM